MGLKDVTSYHVHDIIQGNEKSDSNIVGHHFVTLQDFNYHRNQNEQKLRREIEQQKKRLDNQSYAIADYQNKIHNFHDLLKKHLEQNYPAPTFRAEVLKIFNTVMPHEPVYPPIDQKDY